MKTQNSGIKYSGRLMSPYIRNRRKIRIKMVIFLSISLLDQVNVTVLKMCTRFKFLFTDNAVIAF